MPDRLSLGAFDVIHPLGRGGMASVFAGVHREQGLPVAVKVLDPRRTRDETFLRCFETEVQAAASLDHPGIVLVFDYGRVPADVAARSDGKLGEGAPYLVMELASGGSLADRKKPLRWQPLRLVLLGLLDSLAHAHARGVIHRDLKKGNVLLATDQDARPGLKLTDFGLAHLSSEASEADATFAGTPNYMAPEQCDGRWRQFGPWTDLYALACLAWSLACGRPPFVARNVMEVIQAQRTREPPPFLPAHPMPEGLQPWLRKLLSKPVHERYACAGDAARVLSELGQPVGEARVVDSTAEEDTLEFERGDVPTRPWTLSSIGAALPSEDEREEPPPRPADTSPVPSTWRRPVWEAPSPQLLGAGLGLMGVREGPLVGWERLRDRLWEGFRATSEGWAGRGVLLSGPPGQGTSRLARWLCERTAELGVAQVLTLRPAVAGSPSAVRRLLTGQLRTEGLSRGGCRKRVRAELVALGCDDEAEAEALTDLLAPRPETPLAPLAMQRELAARQLQRLSERRPLVLWLEDAHLDVDACGLVDALLERQRLEPCPLLVLATATRFAPCAIRDPGILRLEVPPLDAAAMAELLRGRLVLADGALGQILDRSAGNPAFALQLLADWVQRGLLRAGPGGFELTPGADPAIPDGLHDLLAGRLDTVEQGEDPQLLEIAAALGPELRADEWRSVCRRGGLSDPASLRSAALAGGLLRVAGEHLRFAGPLLRESVVRRSQEAGRWAGLNRLCAERLSGRFDAESRARRGHHLLQADEPMEAAESLLAAVRGSRLSGSVAENLRRLDQVELVLAERPARLGEVRALRMDLLGSAGRLDEAALLAESLLAEGGLAPAVEAAALEAAGQMDLRRRDLDAAWQRFDDALLLRRELGDPRGVVDALRLLARTLSARGMLDAARAHARAALVEAERADDALARAEAELVLGGVERRADNLERAAELCSRAGDAFDGLGRPLRVAEARLLAGEALRRLGSLDAAEAAYRQARTIYARAGSHYAHTVDLNLALVQVRRSAWDEAALRIRRVLQAAESTDDAFLGRAARIMLLPALAARGHWSSLDAVLDELAALGDPGRYPDGDLADAAELAGLQAASEQQNAVAVRCWELALLLWRVLGDEERSAVLEETLATQRAVAGAPPA